jgi:hypothetical protein
MAFELEDDLRQLVAYGDHGFERIVLEDSLADFIPEIFWIKFWRLARKV